MLNIFKLFILFNYIACDEKEFLNKINNFSSSNNVNNQTFFSFKNKKIIKI